MAFLDPRDLKDPRSRARLGGKFVSGYFSALGARTEPRGPSLLRVEVTRDQLCELEQRPANTWYATNHIPELTTLYIALTDDESTDEEHVESGTPGSWRFGLMQRSAQRIGAMTRLRIVPRKSASDSTYRPFLVFGFEVSYRCAQHRNTLLPIAVDLVTGASGEELATQLLLRTMDEQPVHKRLAQRREVRYKHAFEIACECVKETVASDPETWDWYYRSAYRLASELDQVEQYFRQRMREGETELDEEKEHAIDEIRRRFQPRIESRPVLGMLVLCPEPELPKVLNVEA